MLNFPCKIILQRGTRYWDPLTKIHLSNRENSKVITQEFADNNDLRNIESAIETSVLRTYEIEQNEEDVEETTEVKQSEETISEEEQVEEESVETSDAEAETTDDSTEDVEKQEETESKLVKTTEDGEPRCQHIKDDDEQCTYTAKYPEDDDPIYCGVHKNKLEE